MRHRYAVDVCWSGWRPEAKGFVDTSHLFTSKVAAETFARAIARCLPRTLSDGSPIAWILVHAFAADHGTAVSVARSVCYLSLDPGAIVVKHHDIPRGFYGSKCRECGPRLDVAA